MDRRAFLCLLALSSLNSMRAQEEPTYLAVGGTLDLLPDTSSVSKPFISILWKHGDNMVAEWIQNTHDFYAQFNQSTSSLSETTGRLVVQDMTAKESGVYSVEFNNVLQKKRYPIKVIREVPQPSVSLFPLRCSSAEPSCTLRCDGDVTGAAPVTYSWRKDGGPWEPSKGHRPEWMNITNDDATKQVEMFSCRMNNPLGHKDSEEDKNPFFSPTSGGGAAAAVLLIIPTAAAAVVAMLNKYRPNLLPSGLNKQLDKISFLKKSKTKPNQTGTLLEQGAVGGHSTAPGGQLQNGEPVPDQPSSLPNPETKSLLTEKSDDAGEGAAAAAAGPDTVETDKLTDTVETDKPTDTVETDKLTDTVETDKLTDTN